MIENNSACNDAFHAHISGRVQGVGFRYYCREEAERLGLSGWVRNEFTGGVEVWAEGSPEKLDKLLQWLHKGPPGARVVSVDYEKLKPAGHNGFEITRSS